MSAECTGQVRRVSIEPAVHRTLRVVPLLACALLVAGCAAPTASMSGEPRSRAIHVVRVNEVETRCQGFPWHVGCGPAKFEGSSAKAVAQAHATQGKRR